MSLIGDALKKANQAKAQNKTPGRTGAPLWIFAAVLLIITLPLVVTTAKNRWWTSDTLTLQAAGDREAGQSQFTIEETRFSTQNTLQRTFQLEGVALTRDGGYALVNGQILKAGQKIQGAEITRIAQNQVELNYNGQKIILKPN